MDWIDIKKDTPKDNQKVIIWFGSGFMEALYIKKEKSWRLVGSSIRINRGIVTHWVLPENPEK